MVNKVLWISRHNVLSYPKTVLSQRLGVDIEIIREDIHITDYNQVYELLEKHNPTHVVANLPKWIWLAVLRIPKYRKIVWLRCVMKIVHRPYIDCKEPCDMFIDSTDAILSTGGKRFGVDYPGRYVEDLHFRFMYYERVFLHKGVDSNQLVSVRW